MRNPYEVLEIKENATSEEVKAAYRELVKKYHPDKYTDHPLQDLAEEKVRELNEAYEYLMNKLENQNKGGYSNQSNGYTGGYSSGQNYNQNQNYNQGNNQNYNQNYGNNNGFQNIRNFINNNNLHAAERELRGISFRNAEWYFLNGMISMRKGWYSQAYQDIQRAVNMEPNNFEYREALNRVNNNNMNFNNNSYVRRGNQNDDFCQMLGCLCCTDQCCECAGGDLISCC